jgi:flagellin-like hook-associated protein FlgL
MDEQTKLQQQIQGLTAAYDALLHEQPTDMVAVTQVANEIIALSRRLAALTQVAAIAPLSDTQRKALQGAVDALQKAIDQSAGTTQILTAATAVAKL